MKCRECEQVLEEHLDGELDARASAAVEAHLAACADCARAYDALLNEQSFYAAYERDIEVSPQMWRGIKARIGQQTTVGKASLRQRVSALLAPLFNVPRFSPALTCALVIVAVALTVGVMKLTGSHEPSQTVIARNEQINVNSNTKQATTATTNTRAMQSAEPSTPASSPASSPNDEPDQKATPENRKSPANEQHKRLDNTLNVGGARVLEAVNRTTMQPTVEQTPEQLVREAEQRYLAAIQLLQRDAAKQHSTLDAQTAARFNESLAAIDRSIAETRRAVQQHAGDPIAAQYMLSAYAKKVEVLREMAHVQQGND